MSLVRQLPTQCHHQFFALGSSWMPLPPRRHWCGDVGLYLVCANASWGRNPRSRRPFFGPRLVGSAWSPDLTEQGIEPNPGPPRSRGAADRLERLAEQCHVWQLNVGSFRVRGLDVLTDASRHMCPSYCFKKRSCGISRGSREPGNSQWVVHHLQSHAPGVGANRLLQHLRRGGVAVAVRRDLPSAVVARHGIASAHFLCVAVGSLVVCSVYRSPSMRAEERAAFDKACARLISPFAVDLSAGVLVAGNFNQDPREEAWAVWEAVIEASLVSGGAWEPDSNHCS